MDVLGGERLHQAAERQIGHREARRATGDEETRDVEIVHPHRDRKTRRPIGQVKVDQGQLGVMLFGGGDGAVDVVGGRDHAIARIVLDQIFQRGRQLAIILYNQDLEHRASPQGSPSLGMASCARRDDLRIPCAHG